MCNFYVKDDIHYIMYNILLCRRKFYHNNIHEMGFFSIFCFLHIRYRALDGLFYLFYTDNNEKRKEKKI